MNQEPLDKLPVYRCHKEVRASKILEIKQSPPDVEIAGGSYDLVCTDATVTVPAGFIDKHNPQVGGYFVVYQDGYVSFSPAQAFESGYMLKPEPIKIGGSFRKKPVVIEAITFDELVQHGIDSGEPLVDGMPWSFTYKGHGITHENDNCYIIPTLEGSHMMTRGDMLITGVKGEIYPCKLDIFEATYEPVQ